MRSLILGLFCTLVAASTAWGQELPPNLQYTTGAVEGVKIKVRPQMTYTNTYSNKPSTVSKGNGYTNYKPTTTSPTPSASTPTSIYTAPTFNRGYLRVNLRRPSAQMTVP